MPRATPADLQAAQRVLLYGVTGAGKSTAAGLLAPPARLPVHLADEEVGWLPGWVVRDAAKQREIAAGVVAGDRWVLDTAYGSWRDLVLPRAQVLVALDYPRWLSLGRLGRRTATRWATRQEMCNGNVETVRRILSRDSILHWHVRSYRPKTERIRAWEGAPDGIPVLRLTHPRALTELLAALEPAHGNKA